MTHTPPPTSRKNPPHSLFWGHFFAVFPRVGPHPRRGQPYLKGCLWVHCLLTVIYFNNVPLIDMAARGGGREEGKERLKMVARYWRTSQGRAGNSSWDKAQTCHSGLAKDTLVVFFSLLSSEKNIQGFWNVLFLFSLHPKNVTLLRPCADWK